MKISVIICTRNRVDGLARTLNSFSDSAKSWDLPWELIIVDNGSTDQTQKIISEFSGLTNFPVRALFVPNPGVSSAKNQGIRQARGEILAFTDDDCLTTSSWLPAICKVFDKDPDVGVVGGRTELWDPTLFPHCVRTSSVEQEYRWPAGPEFLVGNNLAFPASVLKKIGFFDVDLGPGTRVYGAEDSDIVYRVLKAGYLGKYVPEACLYHDHRRTIDELKPIRRNYAVGNGAFLMKHILAGDGYALKKACYEVKSLMLCRKSLRSRYVPDRMTILRAMALGAAARLVHPFGSKKWDEDVPGTKMDFVEKGSPSQ